MTDLLNEGTLLRVNFIRDVLSINNGEYSALAVEDINFLLTIIDGFVEYHDELVLAVEAIQKQLDVTK